MIEAQGRYLGHAAQLGGEQPAMAGDDVAVAIRQDRDIEAERINAVEDLPDLLLAVAPRVGGIEP